jgi:hypothetical protein
VKVGAGPVSGVARCWKVTGADGATRSVLRLAAKLMSAQATAAATAATNAYVLSWSRWTWVAAGVDDLLIGVLLSLFHLGAGSRLQARWGCPAG